MATYKRINLTERREIEQLLRQNLGISQVARRLGRSKSSISEEVRRAGMSAQSYSASKATGDCKKKRRRLGPSLVIKGALRTIVDFMLMEHYCSRANHGCNATAISEFTRTKSLP